MIDQEQFRREALAQIRADRVTSFLANSNVPHKFTNVSPDFEGDRELVWFTAALEGRSTGPLILSGTVGTGKSHKSCSMLRAFIEKRNSPGYYITAAEYCRDIRSTWSGRADFSEAQILRRYSETTFLVLDDLGAGKAADVDLIQDLICERYDAGLLPYTVVSTNIAAPAFNERFGERVADRLREGATLIELTGASLRRPAA